MSLISLHNVSFTYPSGNVPVFDQISFSFDTDWKTGLIGRNGKGKTTLFALLQGKYTYSGSSQLPGNELPGLKRMI